MLSDELFVKEMRILWQNTEKRLELLVIIRTYFGDERGYKIIEKMQVGL